MSHSAINTAISENLADLTIDEQQGDLYLIRNTGQLIDELDDADLDNDDLDFIEDHAGLIITRKGDSCSIRWFNDEDALEDTWADLCADTESDNESEEDDDDEQDEEE